MPFHAIEHLLQQAEKGAPALRKKLGSNSTAPDLVQAHVGALRVNLAYSQNEPRRRVIELGAKTLEKFPADNLLIRTNTLFTMALAYLDTGELDDCARCLDQARSAAFMGDYAFQVILADSFRIFLTKLRGDLPAAKAMCRDGLESVRQAFVETGRIPAEISGYYHLHDAAFLYEANRLTEAAQALEKAMEAVDMLGETYSRLLAFQLMFFIRLHSGAAEADVLAPLGEMEKLSVYCSRARSLAGSLRIVHMVSRFGGDGFMLRRACAMAEQYGLDPGAGPDPHDASIYPVPFEKNLRIYQQLNLVHLYLACPGMSAQQGAAAGPADVCRHLENLLETIRKQGFGELEAEALIMLAAALHHQGRCESAARYFKQALCMGQSRGYLRMFLNMGATLAPLLRDSIASGVCVEYASRLLGHIKSCTAGGPAGSEASPSVHAGLLSRQENAVLQLIARGLSNQQIAEELCIAVATVKTHNYNIYKKLNVSSRTAAAGKAKHLNIF